MISFDSRVVAFFSKLRLKSKVIFVKNEFISDSGSLNPVVLFYIINKFWNPIQFHENSELKKFKYCALSCKDYWAYRRGSPDKWAGILSNIFFFQLQLFFGDLFVWCLITSNNLWFLYCSNSNRSWHRICGKSIRAPADFFDLLCFPEVFVYVSAIRSFCLFAFQMV